MPLRSVASEDGFSIRGAAPKDIGAFPGGAMLFWGWVLELALKAKDRDLAQGLDKDGKPLRPISAATRKHRMSAMTPGGRGDPSAPPLEPGRQKSRTRSLLTGRAFADHIELWWKFDPWTGDSWAAILRYQADEGRDVFGLSPAGLARVERQALERWRRWTSGKAVAAPVVPMPTQALLVIQPIGRMDLRYATLGIGGPGRAAMEAGQRRGGLTLGELERHLRTPAKVSIPGRPRGEYNVLLRQIWGEGKMPGPPRIAPIPVVPPKPKPIPKIVMKTAKPAKPKKEKVPSGVVFVRAPAGGAISDVTGKFYKGGQLMPVHGLYAGEEKPPPKEVPGIGGGPVKAKEDAKKRDPREIRIPKSQEEIAREQIDQQLWTEARGGPIGEIYHLGERPHPINRPPDLAKWQEWVEVTGGIHLGRSRETAEEIFARNTLANLKEHERRGMSDDEVKKLLLENLRLTIEDAGRYLKKKHAKAFPESGPTIETIRAAIDSKIGKPVDELATINRAMTGQPIAKIPEKASQIAPKPLVIVTPAQQSAFRADVLAVAHQVEQFYEGKVFIHHVWTELVKDSKYADLTLERFKELLVSDPAFRALMARADLVQAMKQADVEASETAYKLGGKVAAEFHFIRVARRS